MSLPIKSNDKVWNIFKQYLNILDAEAKGIIDIYGTDIRTTLASSLTLAHVIDESAESVGELLKREERARHHIKPSRGENAV
jgi:hypothetical protein|tara:strand:- start:227 stop:472 length:246 start_codon:yes stop_codon:yes gene_type:complete